MEDEGHGFGRRVQPGFKRAMEELVFGHGQVQSNIQQGLTIWFKFCGVGAVLLVDVVPVVAVPPVVPVAGAPPADGGC